MANFGERFFADLTNDIVRDESFTSLTIFPLSKKRKAGGWNFMGIKKGFCKLISMIKH